ncbi:glycosyl transferase [Ruegeria sp. 2205SS24-7]|uniref:glycosyl transferase n=1 Tax=Ruegeria discodermiae TaxID=3064389 RepID=UPI00274037F4|nr:glycosyl transferase [Ruegeria sp. 2205SS24-7]MDP5215881.1 glycosyl transferase [Ruegeria sp. 2205SS24-7]
MDKQIVCINWGTKYGAPYINRLYEMVRANITPPFRFVAFTDTREGVHPDIVCFDLPEMPGFMPERTIGQWPKSRLWAPELGDLKGPFLFLDLDVVITGSLDPFFEFGSEEDVVLARNITKPLHKLGQTSIYRMPVGALAPLQAQFAADPQAVADKYRFEQHFVTKNAPNGIKFWPSGWVRHFRIECIPTFPLNYFKPSRPPKGTRVVIFAGSLNPPDAIAGRYHPSYAFLPPWQHIKRSLKSHRKLRYLRQFMWPADWVKEIWDKADRAWQSALEAKK